MDLYRDFAYCVLTNSVDDTTTTVVVDETRRLPSNAELASLDFWMTFESSYAADQFEIVRLVSKSTSTGPGTLVLVRGQQGSLSYPRAAGYVLKHALTAEMLQYLVALAQQQGGGYKRYVDLGNPATVAGIAQVFSDPIVLRGISAGQSGGATVVGGALVVRGVEASSAGQATASADATVAQPVSGTATGASTTSGSALVAAGGTSTSSGLSTTAGDLTVTATAADSSGLVGATMYGT